RCDRTAAATRRPCGRAAPRGCHDATRRGGGRPDVSGSVPERGRPRASGCRHVGRDGRRGQRRHRPAGAALPAPSRRPAAGRAEVGAVEVSVWLRPMRWWDVDAVLPIEAEVFAGDPPWTAELFWSELAGVPDTRWYVVAEDTGDVCGYAGLLFSDEVADVQTLAVAPRYQRRGIGRMLLEALIAQAQTRRAREL